MNEQEKTQPRIVTLVAGIWYSHAGGVWQPYANWYLIVDGEYMATDNKPVAVSRTSPEGDVIGRAEKWLVSSGLLPPSPKGYPFERYCRDELGIKFSTAIFEVATKKSLSTM